MNASRISRVLALIFSLLIFSNVGLAQDECASATATGEATGIALDTGAATVDAVPASCGLPAPDVWLAYTASCTGTATIETTSGPGGDTILEVLDACGGTVLACDDDGGPGFLSLINLSVTSGTTYFVRASGWNGGAGPITMDISCTTAGDECAIAIATGEGTGIAVDTTAATNDATAPSCGLPAPDVWLAYTAGCDGTATIETTSGPGGDTVLEVLDACGGTVLVCDDDGGSGFLSLINMAVTAGTTYYVRASGWNGGAGPITMDISCSGAPPPVAPGDECVDALAAVEGGNAYDLTDATVSAEAADNSTCDATSGEDVWLSWTAPGDGAIDVTTCGASVGGVATDDSDLYLYEGDCAALTQLACDGDACGGGGGWGSTIAGTPVTSGMTYYIRVNTWNGGTGGQGIIDLTFTAAGSPEDCSTPGDEDVDGLADCADPDCFADPNCAGDECSNAHAAVEGANAYDLSWATISADAADNAPCDTTGPNEDHWFSFTPTDDGAIDVTTCGASVGGVATHDSDIYLYEGSCGALTQLACDGDACGGGGGWGSTISGAAVTAGNTVYLRVSGWNGAIGAGIIDLTFVPAGLPEDCATPGDEDLDGLADCADPDCAAEPQCIEAGNCADGVDNDLDGVVDCNDSDCSADAACQACPTFVTQNTDPAGVDPAPLCSAGGVHADNEFHKSWDTATELAFAQCPDGIRVTGVEYSIDTAISGDGNGQDLVINLWLDPDGGAPDANMALLHSETVNVPDGTSGLQVATLSTPVAYPTGAVVVASLLMPDAFFSGLNHQMRLAGSLSNAETWWTATACGFPPYAAYSGFAPPIETSPVLNLITDDQGAGVPGDECSSAVAAVDGPNPFDTTIMSPSADDNGCSTASLNTDMWMRYVATAPGALVASTCNDADFDTKLSLYDACGGTCLAYTDDTSGCAGFTGEVATEVTLGQVVYIRIGGFGSSSVGTGNLTITVTPPAPVLNEIRIDQAGADNDEFVELAGYAQSLDGLSLIVIGDGAGASGVVESIVDLTGSSISASGYFVVGESSMTTGTPDLIATLGFENGDNVTHLLVRDYDAAGAPLQTDLDTDDDGVLDVTPWSEIVDCVAMVENFDIPANGDHIYCANTVGPDGSFVPAHTERCPDGSGPWFIGQFADLTGDSPGASNSCLSPPANDECVDAFVATNGDNSIWTASATESTDPWDVDDGSGGCAGGAGGGVSADVWYSYTAAADGTIVVSTCDTVTFDSQIGVYEGACGSLVTIGGACDTGGCSNFTSTTDPISVTGGETYIIRIGSWQTDAGGTGVFNIAFDAAGDECDTALIAVDGDNNFDTTNFTDSADAADGLQCDGTFLGAISNDGWYSYTSAIDGTLSVSTCGTTAMDTDLVIYSGDCTALTQLACNGDATGCPDFTSLVETTVSAGESVLIRLGAWTSGDSGTGIFNVTVTPFAVDPTASATATYLDLGGNPVSAPTGPFANFVNIQIDDASDNGGDAAATYTIDLQGSGLPPETFTVGDPNNSPYTVGISAPASIGDDLLGLTVTPVITVTNLLSSDTVTLDTITIYAVGDANGDLTSGGSASALPDIMYLLAYMYQGGPGSPCERVNDVNSDGSADLGDVVYGLYYLFAGGAPPIPSNSIDCAL